MKSPSKETVLSALDSFMNQRPGLEFGNYGDISLYRSESRSITKDLHHASALMAAVAWRDGITADDILKAMGRAYSGRLSYSWNGETFKLDYCTGQYFPTEYRKAVCAVLSSCLWDYWRDDCETGDDIRNTARKNLPRGIANTWFN